MNFGINLKQLRREKNLTQEELAECLNLSPQTISKWENRLSMPDISLLPVLADYFGITVDALLLHDAGEQKKEMKEFAKHIHELEEQGKMQEAYDELKASMGKWALSVPMNNLMSIDAYRLSKEKDGEEKQGMLEEAIMYADRVIRLDGGETARTPQAKMTKCFCMADLGRRKEAIQIAQQLPSVYSSRERVLVKIAEGPEKAAYIETALQYLGELREELEEMRK